MKNQSFREQEIFLSESPFFLQVVNGFSFSEVYFIACFW